MSSAAISIDLVIWLDGQEVSRELVGGKGASLSRLIALGAPVPPAFALSTHAYELMAEASGLPRRASDVQDCDLPALRAVIESSPLPTPVLNELGDAFATLNNRAGGEIAVAVRSSATAEDSGEFSFAGLHDTVLDVRTFEQLEAAVKRAWASLWTERAVAYRRQGGLATDEAAIAVVVQQMVRSDVSFVAFTADPVSGRADQVLINAAWGLGEALVSGTVTPDAITVTMNGIVSDYRIGEKAEMVIPHHNGGTRSVPVPRALRVVPALEHDQAEAIAAMARGLAGNLGYPADLEGGLVGGQIMLFQARPITTLGGIAA